MKYKIMRTKLKQIIALSWVAFQLYIALVGGLPAIAQRIAHVSFPIMLVFVTIPMNKEKEKLSFFVDMTIFVLALAYMIYSLSQSNRLMVRIPYIDQIFSADLFFGVILILLLLEGGRRNMGLSLPIVCLVFIAYGFLGPYMPGILRHRGINLSTFIEVQTLGTNGIFSSPIATSTTTIFYFMIFGAFLAATPAGKLFISMAKFMTQKTKGGEGKAAIAASALFGMISGSAAANVATTGVITYPMMEKAGFRPRFSASILAIGGTGGQLFPPIMGAAAFIMADMVGVSYFKIILYAIIPSILYVMSLIFVVHFEAKRCDIISEKVDKKVLIEDIKKFIHLLIPLVLLIYLIIKGRSLMYSAIISIAVLIILCFIRKESRMSMNDILKTLISGAMSSVTVAMPCALAGIVIGIMVYSGLGLRFSSLVASLSSGNLLLALSMAMVMIIILGMGMPSSAAYVMSAVLLSGAITNLGVEPIVAHMFIFYFANLSMITPPVALASYTAAGIAGTKLWDTGIEAFKLSMVIFMIPFIFVYEPALLGLGNIPSIIYVIITTGLGVFAMAAGIIGYVDIPIKPYIRVLLVLSAIMMIIPHLITDIIGIIILAMFMIYNWKQKKKMLLM
jgi:TRAP transporter 4TM/12TM fusion protein